MNLTFLWFCRPHGKVQIENWGDVSGWQMCPMSALTHELRHSLWWCFSFFISHNSSVLFWSCSNLRCDWLPVREQCKVLFPYEAQNEDELLLKEGDIINIITKVRGGGFVCGLSVLAVFHDKYDNYVLCVLSRSVPMQAGGWARSEEGKVSSQITSSNCLKLRKRWLLCSGKGWETLLLLKNHFN